ncbi:MAG: hypothetical protein BM555_04030 [Crocinitomix sp. MedPE-SWsnd]|nr:MAG: hypothetical protein BM555_04030 [Crocinitomix sp. MedPE-SWsnd]
MKHEIPFNKTRYSLAAIFCVALVTIGIFMVLQPENFDVISVDYTFLLQIGIFLSILFGASLIFVLFKLFNGSMGLTIDHEGITDNAGGLKFGLISWTNITAFSMKKHVGNTFILIHINNEDEVLNSLGKVKRRLVQENMKTFETPIAISATMLKIKADDLVALFKSVGQEKGIEFRD